MCGWPRGGVVSREGMRKVATAVGECTGTVSSVTFLLNSFTQFRVSFY